MIDACGNVVVDERKEWYWNAVVVVVVVVFDNMMIAMEGVRMVGFSFQNGEHSYYLLYYYYYSIHTVCEAH